MILFFSGISYFFRFSLIKLQFLVLDISLISFVISEGFFIISLINNIGVKLFLAIISVVISEPYSFRNSLCKYLP